MKAATTNVKGQILIGECGVKVDLRTMFQMIRTGSFFTFIWCQSQDRQIPLLSHLVTKGLLVYDGVPGECPIGPDTVRN